ncbi:MAG: hypothetical protein LUC51_09045, partial [Cloacibacillus porcorum]|nr:hypothetical protein [Cloacibacillus porcorum]
MIIRNFAIKKSREEAKREAARKGFIARLFSGKGKENIVMKTLYIENRLITFEITSPPPLFERLFRRGALPRKSKIEMIANGSTGGVSYYDRRGVEPVESEVGEDEVQLSDFSDETLITRGNALARRILRRRVGGNLSLEVLKVESVFCPDPVAFVGEPREGADGVYLPIAAGGGSG